MHPREYLGVSPDRPAVIMAGSGAAITFAELDRCANQCGHLFRRLGLVPGDRVALWMENHPRFFEICWAAHNTGLLFVPISARLTVGEAEYIARDCDAKLIIASSALPAAALRAELGDAVLIMGVPGGFEDQAAEMPAHPVADETRGAAMVYSSGTTGRPKGIAPVREAVDIGMPPAVAATLLRLYGFDNATIYLSTAPLYHTAPLKFTMCVQSAGGTVVVLEKFDPTAALDAIERFRVTHSQWVPTMFVRMLPLRGVARDLSSHRVAIHSAAPCPVPVKQQMLDWWGPILYEYYSGSESVGMCAITPQEWLERPGSVGRVSRGLVHVLGPEGEELGPGQTGNIYFEGGSKFVYHKDMEKTARAMTREGWTTFGDIGHVDADGYVFLTDRRDYVINVGGVNIYPQEAENLLSLHEKIADVAVFGIPHPEYGEEVKAVVELHNPAEAGPELAAELIAYCRAGLAAIKCPRSVDFEAQMPREPTGKLLKRKLKARYWPEQEKKAVLF
jgi:acyl-CoA synthetase (AMP-forming)/AMP-acid ligase II